MITKKKILSLLQDPSTYSFDGSKHYFVIRDHLLNGDITVIKYPDRYTVYRKNESYWNVREVEVTEKELLSLLWQYRRGLR